MSNWYQDGKKLLLGVYIGENEPLVRFWKGSTDKEVIIQLRESQITCSLDKDFQTEGKINLDTLIEAVYCSGRSLNGILSANLAATREIALQEEVSKGVIQDQKQKYEAEVAEVERRKKLKEEATYWIRQEQLIQERIKEIKKQEIQNKEKEVKIHEGTIGVQKQQIKTITKDLSIQTEAKSYYQSTTIAGSTVGTVGGVMAGAALVPVGKPLMVQLFAKLGGLKKFL